MASSVEIVTLLAALLCAPAMTAQIAPQPITEELIQEVMESSIEGDGAVFEHVMIMQDALQMFGEVAAAGGCVLIDDEYRLSSIRHRGSTPDCKFNGDILCVDESLIDDLAEDISSGMPWMAPSDALELAKIQFAAVMVEEMSHIALNKMPPGMTPDTVDARTISCWEAEAQKVMLDFLCLKESFVSTSVGLGMSIYKGIREATYQKHFQVWNT